MRCSNEAMKCGFWTISSRACTRTGAPVRNRASVASAIAGVDVVFHEASHQDSMPEYEKFFHSNVVGTALLFEVIRERCVPVQKVVIASSPSVYGEGQYSCSTHGVAKLLPVLENQRLLIALLGAARSCKREGPPTTFGFPQNYRQAPQIAYARLLGRRMNSQISPALRCALRSLFSAAASSKQLSGHRYKIFV